MANVTVQTLLTRVKTLVANSTDEMLESILIPSMDSDAVIKLCDKFQAGEDITAQDHFMLDRFVAECIIGLTAVYVAIKPTTTVEDLEHIVVKHLTVKEIQACEATQNKL